MIESYIQIIAKELAVKPSQVSSALKLLDESATVPFIARYRKEVTGSLDEVAVAAIRDRIEQLRELDKRREAVIKSLEERNLLTDDLSDKIQGAESMAVLEDIYLPFRPKRRTRATAAKEKGLEPLARKIFEQTEIDLEAEASAYIDTEKGVESAEEALAGARDIIAEWISEDQQVRETMRKLFADKGMLRSKVFPKKKEEGIKYKDYYEWEEPALKAPSHRVLAIRRGESEGYLSFHITPSEDEAVALLEPLFIKGDGGSSNQVKLALQDSYKRLLSSPWRLKRGSLSRNGQMKKRYVSL